MLGLFVTQTHGKNANKMKWNKKQFRIEKLQIGREKIFNVTNNGQRKYQRNDSGYCSYGLANDMLECIIVRTFTLHMALNRLKCVYIVNAATHMCKATANTLLCVFFCWIYRLLVFGQRHNSHLSSFISELIYLRIIFFRSLNQHEKCEHFVFIIVARTFWYAKRISLVWNVIVVHAV